MIDNQEVTTSVIILDVLPGSPHRILTGEWSRRNGNPARLFQQMITVPDTALFAHFEAQARKQDTVQITVTTEWREDGYSTYLSGFVCPPAVARSMQKLVA